MTISIIHNNLVKSRGYSQVIKNCLGYVAFSREFQDKLLQRQARALLDLLSKNELLPGERVGLLQADEDLSAYQDFIQRQGEVRL